MGATGNYTYLHISLRGTIIKMGPECVHVFITIIYLYNLEGCVVINVQIFDIGYNNFHRELGWFEAVIYTKI